MPDSDNESDWGEDSIPGSSPGSKAGSSRANPAGSGRASPTGGSSRASSAGGSSRASGPGSRSGGGGGGRRDRDRTRARGHGSEDAPLGFNTFGAPIVTVTQMMMRGIREAEALRNEIRDSLYNEKKEYLRAREEYRGPLHHMPHTKNFVVLHFYEYINIDGESFPSEFCVIAFNIFNGITFCEGSIIDPGRIPVGFAYDVAKFSEKAHLPLPGYNRSFNAIEKVMNPILELIRLHVGPGDYVYTREEDMPLVWRAMKFMFIKTGMDFFFRLAPLHVLVNVLMTEADVLREINSLEAARSVSHEAESRGILSNYQYDYNPELACLYHQGPATVDGIQYCSMSLVKYMVFNILQLATKYYGVLKFKPCHAPGPSGDRRIVRGVFPDIRLEYESEDESRSGSVSPSFSDDVSESKLETRFVNFPPADFPLLPSRPDDDSSHGGSGRRSPASPVSWESGSTISTRCSLSSSSIHSSGSGSDDGDAWEYSSASGSSTATDSSDSESISSTDTDSTISPPGSDHDDDDDDDDDDEDDDLSDTGSDDTVIEVGVGQAHNDVLTVDYQDALDLVPEEADVLDLTTGVRNMTMMMDMNKPPEKPKEEKDEKDKAKANKRQAAQKPSPIRLSEDVDVASSDQFNARVASLTCHGVELSNAIAILNLLDEMDAENKQAQLELNLLDEFKDHFAQLAGGQFNVPMSDKKKPVKEVPYIHPPPVPVLGFGRGRMIGKSPLSVLPRGFPGNKIPAGFGKKIAVAQPIPEIVEEDPLEKYGAVGGLPFVPTRRVSGSQLTGVSHDPWSSHFAESSSSSIMRALRARAPPPPPLPMYIGGSAGVGSDGSGTDPEISSGSETSSNFDSVSLPRPPDERPRMPKFSKRPRKLDTEEKEQ